MIPDREMKNWAELKTNVYVNVDDLIPPNLALIKEYVKQGISIWRFERRAYDFGRGGGGPI